MPKRPSTFKTQTTLLQVHWYCYCVYSVTAIAELICVLQTNGPALPTGGALALHQDYNGDIDLYLGPELISSLGSTIEGTCNTDNTGCESSIQDALLGADYELQSRAVGFALFAGGLLLAAFAQMIIELYKQDGKVPIRVNLAAKVASSIKAAQQASDIDLAATNEPVLEVPITEIPTATSTITLAPINPNALTGTAVQVSVATNGNYLLRIQDPTALIWLQDQAEKPCSTESKKHKRLSDCAPQFAADAMAALPNDLINFLTIDKIAPLVTGGALAASLQSVFNAGRSLTQLVAFSDATITAVAVLFLVLFDEALNHQQTIATINTLPSSDFDETSTATSITSGSCPTGSNAPACQDSSCLGIVTIGTCTSSGTVSGCSCAPVITPYFNYGNASWLTIQQALLASIVDLGALYPPRPTCTYDGAPWMSPTGWCECFLSTSSSSLLTFPTLPPSTGLTTTTITPNCNYKILPAETINPITTTPAPTNIPGENGIPACAFVSYPDETACTLANYCNCDGIGVRFLTLTVDGQTVTNCDYTIQPTVNDCPPPTTTLPSLSAPTPTLRCNPTDKANYTMFSRDLALTQITALCQSWRSESYVLGQDTVKDSPLEQKLSTSTGDNGVGIAVAAVWTSAGCNEPAIDFESIPVETCVQMFLPAMDSCKILPSTLSSFLPFFLSFFLPSLLSISLTPFLSFFPSFPPLHPCFDFPVVARLSVSLTKGANVGIP